MDRDLACTAWYMHQVGALHTLAFGKYNFNKFQVTPEEIIEMEVREIQLKYSQGKLDTESREQIKRMAEIPERSVCRVGPGKRADKEDQHETSGWPYPPSSVTETLSQKFSVP